MKNAGRVKGSKAENTLQDINSSLILSEARFTKWNWDFDNDGVY